MDRNNECHEFLLFYLGHSMKSRRSQIKVSEFKVSSMGESYSIGNRIGFFKGHETP